jgi:hypothetical protein
MIFSTANLQIFTHKKERNFDLQNATIYGIYQLHEHLERLQDKVGIVKDSKENRKGLRWQAFFVGKHISFPYLCAKIISYESNDFRRRTRHTSRSAHQHNAKGNGSNQR